MNIPNIGPEGIVAAIALVTSVINHFRVSSVVAQVRSEIETELAAFKTSLAADATLAAARILADALLASARLKSEAVAKESL